MARIRIDEEYNRKRLGIVKAALNILFEEGSENLTVNYLLRKINMSKGAFFHYFKSKEELLNSVLDYAIEPIYEKMVDIMEQKDLDVMKRFVMLFHTAGVMKADYGKGLMALAEVIYLNSNKLFLVGILERTLHKCMPLIEQIILEGIESGDFHVQYPHGAAFHILTITMGINQEIGHYLMSEPSAEDKKLLMEKIYSGEIIVSSILGCESFVLYQPATLQRIGVS